MKYYDYYFWENFFSIDEIKNINKISELFMNKNFIDQPAFTDKNKNLKNLKKKLNNKNFDVPFKKNMWIFINNLNFFYTMKQNYFYHIFQFLLQLHLDSILFHLEL